MRLLKKKGLIFFMKKAENTPTKATENTQEQETEILIKDETKHNFIIVYDTIYKSKLTLEELGLLVKLLACAPSFKPTIKKLETELNASNRKILRAVKGLKQKGFLSIENNFKSGSVWTITQEPILNKVKGYTEQEIINALLDYEITTKDLKILLHKKFIDYPSYQAILKGYIKELQKIIKVDAYEDLKKKR